MKMYIYIYIDAYYIYICKSAAFLAASEAASIFARFSALLCLIVTGAGGYAPPTSRPTSGGVR